MYMYTCRCVDPLHCMLKISINAEYKASSSVLRLLCIYICSWRVGPSYAYVVRPYFTVGKNTTINKHYFHVVSREVLLFAHQCKRALVLCLHRCTLYTY